MVNHNRIQPYPSSSIDSSGQKIGETRQVNETDTGTISSLSRINDFDSCSASSSGDVIHSKLKEFSALDPSLSRLLVFLKCFGLAVNFVEPSKRTYRKSRSSLYRKLSPYLKIMFTVIILIMSSQVVYDTNLNQSKLLTQRKRSAPLLNFIMLAYSWSTVIIPAISDFFLILMASHLFRFHSRTMATVCSGSFYGKKTFVDGWLYYLALIMLAFIDAIAQLALLGVWPPFVSDTFGLVSSQNNLGMSKPADGQGLFCNNTSHTPLFNMTKLEGTTMSSKTFTIMNDSHSMVMISGSANESITSTSHRIMEDHSVPDLNHLSRSNCIAVLPEEAKIKVIKAYLLDLLLGEEYANGNLGICLKGIMLLVQFVHSYAFFLVVSSLSNHYATVLESINKNLEKYESRKLLKQMIVLRNSSEQISLMISLPFSLVTLFVFMRQIALIGVLMQGTMPTLEIWAVCLQTITGGLSVFMVFNFCDGLQAASRETHRLKTYQSVIDDESGGDQSIYEFLDYLNRLSKAIRITFFNIITIDKHSLVSLFGHMLTLTFLTS